MKRHTLNLISHTNTVCCLCYGMGLDSKKAVKKYSMSPSARGTVKSSHKKIQYAVSATLGQCPSDINKLFPMFTIESQNVISHRY